MINTLLVDAVAGYLVLGAIITAWSWRRRDDSDADLIDLAMDLNASGPADRLARALGTGLAILVGMLHWPLNVGVSHACTAGRSGTRDTADPAPASA